MPSRLAASTVATATSYASAGRLTSSPARSGAETALPHDAHQPTPSIRRNALTPVPRRASEGCGIRNHAADRLTTRSRLWKVRPIDAFLRTTVLQGGHWSRRRSNGLIRRRLLGEHHAGGRRGTGVATAARYDFVIVGGGSAGSVLANRLSAERSNRVLVLEAGRPDYAWDLFIHMPAALSFPIGSRFYDWRYQSEPEPQLHGRRVYHARGKVLGGSSSINGMIFQRGNPLDYQRWAAAPGMEDWDYAHCLPYFKRMETCLAADPEDLHRGRRLSASRAYLHPVLGRPNLRVATRALVTRVLFDGEHAVGVEYARGGGAPRRVGAGEVILCGGAINTPQTLQLSGVGNADELKALGIEVVADLPGVGENLQDHLEVYVQHACKLPVSVAPYLKYRYRPWVALLWLFRSGPGATNHFEAGGFARGNAEVAYPNLMLHFLPIAVRYSGARPSGDHGYQVHIGPMSSDARGSVKITGTDPRAHPALRFKIGRA